MDTFKGVCKRSRCLYYQTLVSTCDVWKYCLRRVTDHEGINLRTKLPHRGDGVERSWRCRLGLWLTKCRLHLFLVPHSFLGMWHHLYPLLFKPLSMESPITWSWNHLNKKNTHQDWNTRLMAYFLMGISSISRPNHPTTSKSSMNTCHACIACCLKVYSIKFFVLFF